MSGSRPKLLLAVGAAVAAFAGSGCHEAKRTFKTNVEFIQIRQFGASQPKLTDMELKFVDCPGNARKIMRAPRDFGECGSKFKVGDKVDVDVEVIWNSERGNYRDKIVRIGDCPIVLDTKDEANYQLVENCTELKRSGSVVGVHCDRKRSDELVKACPWFFRK